MTSVWRAMAGNPVRFLGSSWPWRSVAYLVGAVTVAGATWCAALPTLFFPPAYAFYGLPVGAVERRRLPLLGGGRAGNPHAEAPDTIRGWLRTRLRERATWRELGYTVSLLTVLLIADLLALFFAAFCAMLLALPLLIALVGQQAVDLELDGWQVDTLGEAWLIGVPGTLLLAYGISALAGGQAAYARWLISTDQQVADLSESRTRLVHAFEAERRRIERDLHDGAQQHLVLLSMSLGLAELELGDHAARPLVADAHAQARQALAEMRKLIHGIHPQVLSDLGLAAALGELAERCPLPVRLDLLLPRLPAPVESAAYFVVAEAVTNAARHAGATGVRVTGRVDGRVLRLEVTDDGRGGADPGRGSGLSGLGDRAAVLGGTLTVDSPPGGPTTIRAVLPCR